VRDVYHIIGGESTHELPQVGSPISRGLFAVKNPLPVFGDVDNDPTRKPKPKLLKRFKDS
jgi:hypothetical protein